MEPMFRRLENAAPLLLLCALLGALSPSAHSEILPRREQPNSDVVLVPNPRVDMVLRAALIRKARKSIDMITYIHGADTVGRLLTAALRDAAKRGVRIRYAYEGGSSRPADPRGATSRLLSDSALTRPAQIIRARIDQKLRLGLYYNDFIHEKVMLIDAGTPDQIAVIGGRNNNNFGLKKADLGFVIRPLNPKRPSLNQDLSTLFERRWQTLTRLYSIERSRPVSPEAAARADAPLAPGEDLLTDESERSELKAYLALLSQAPGRRDKLKEYQFRPSATQLSFNEMLADVTQGVTLSNSERDQLVNDNHTLLAEVVRGARNLLQASYVFAPSEPIRDAYHEALSRGARLEVLTNSGAAHGRIFPTGAPILYTETGSEEFWSPESPFSRQTRIFLLDPARAEEQASTGAKDAFEYLHRKLVIADDWVVTGSDNFTVASTRKNDELLAFMKDARLAQYLRRMISREKRYYTEVKSSESFGAHLGTRIGYGLFGGVVRRTY